MVFLIGITFIYLHHLSYRRTCQAQDAYPPSKPTCKTTKGSVSSCPSDHIMSSGSSSLFTSDVKRTPLLILPITCWRGTIRESLWMMVPKEAQCPQGAIDCQHDRLHVSYAKEEGKKGSPGPCCPAAADIACGKGLASQDQWWSCLGMMRKLRRELLLFPAWYLLPRLEWK